MVVDAPVLACAAHTYYNVNTINYHANLINGVPYLWLSHLCGAALLPLVLPHQLCE